MNENEKKMAVELSDEALEQSSGGAMLYGKRWKCKECGRWNVWGLYMCKNCGADKASDCEVKVGGYVP